VEKDHTDEEAALTVPERARLRELERENRDLRMQNDFLKKGCQEHGRSYEVAGG
jgi:hypothetical protein